MSQENVDIVRDSLRAFEEGGLDAMAETWTADINWRAMEGALDDVGEMHGREALLRYYEDWLGMFDDFSVVLEEVLDVGDDRAVAVVHVTARAKASGVRTELRYAVAYTVRDGKIARGREYVDREHALAAAGLRE